MLFRSSISSSLCDANLIEGTEDSLGQDKVLNGASSNSSPSSSHGSHICLMARSSNPSDDEDNGEDDDNEEDEHEAYIDSLNKKGEMVYHYLGKNQNAYSNFLEIMTCAIESTKLIKEHENKIDKMGALEREYANDIASVKEALEDRKSVV